MDEIAVMLEYGRRFIGKPYIYGGTGPVGFDCSGLICELLRRSGMINADMTAYQLHAFFKPISDVLEKPRVGALCFYGSPISHVAISIDETFILESGGGDHRTVTPELADSHGAMVRERKYDYRRDLTVILMPTY